LAPSAGAYSSSLFLRIVRLRWPLTAYRTSLWSAVRDGMQDRNTSALELSGDFALLWPYDSIFHPSPLCFVELSDGFPLCPPGSRPSRLLENSNGLLDLPFMPLSAFFPSVARAPDQLLSERTPDTQHIRVFSRAVAPFGIVSPPVPISPSSSFSSSPLPWLSSEVGKIHSLPLSSLLEVERILPSIPGSSRRARPWIFSLLMFSSGAASSPGEEDVPPRGPPPLQSFPPQSAPAVRVSNFFFPVPTGRGVPHDRDPFLLFTPWLFMSALNKSFVFPSSPALRQRAPWMSGLAAQSFSP